MRCTVTQNREAVLNVFGFKRNEKVYDSLLFAKAIGRSKPCKDPSEIDSCQKCLVFLVVGRLTSVSAILQCLSFLFCPRRYYKSEVYNIGLLSPG
jgi:hypothetical protein